MLADVCQQDIEHVAFCAQDLCIAVQFCTKHALCAAIRLSTVLTDCHVQKVC